MSDAFKRKAQDLAAFSQTWIGSLANQVHFAVGKANPWVKGWRHLSVLDGKTSGVCLNRHGKMWNKQGEPLGHDLAFKVPPVHINCRSRLVYVFDAEEPFDGATGEDWVKRRSLSQLQEQFGKGVGQMLYDGEISLADAVKSGGLQPMSLTELRRKYAATLYSAGFSERFKEVRHLVGNIKTNGGTLADVRSLVKDKVWQVAVLNKQARTWLGASTGRVWLSEDTLAKQFFHHPEIGFGHYAAVSRVLNQADLVVQVDDLKLVFFRENDDIYEAVVKATHNREEIYLVSVFETNEKEMRRIRRKGKVLRERTAG